MTSSKRLLPSDWAVAALSAIAVDGVDNLSIERLAASIGVTKGSFYWHFADRAAVIVAAAEEWERLATDEIIVQLADVADPRDRLRSMFDVSIGDDDHAPIDTAMAARVDDELIGHVVRRVTAKRVGFIETIFDEIGFSPSVAARQARLAYAAYLGHLPMARALPTDDPVLAAGRSAYLDQIVHSLAPRTVRDRRSSESRT